MITCDLKSVKYPANIAEKLEKETKDAREQMVDALVRGNKEEGIEPFERSEAEKKAIKRYPKEKFDPVKEFEETINGAISNWMQKEHWDKERKQIIAPWDIRKLSGRISNKIVDAEEGTFELSNEQLDFLLKVFQSDLPPATYFFYVGEYLEELKAKASQEEKESKKKD